MALQHDVLTPLYPVPDWWQSSVEEVDQLLSKDVALGEVRTISVSPGGRSVRAVCYGDAEPKLRGLANFNSAMGAGDPDAYFKRRERKRPVLFVVAGVHGHEVEGVASALSLIQLMETGKDARGKEQQALRKKMQQCRVIIIPLANPDGRIRVPYRGWVGLTSEEMTLRGQGCRKNGELYRWRGSKSVHPMVGNVGLLGAYFDDNGVNMMHDDWANPMSETTKALLQLVANEGPDCVLNLHSYAHYPALLQSAYVPQAYQQRVYDVAQMLYARLHQAGFRHASLSSNALRVGVEEDVHLGMNLQSMFFHVGAAFGLLFESPHGVGELAEQFDYDDILEVHLHLFEAAVDDVLLRHN
ncbi:M14 family zinc carboxypeptidase [Paenibacillus oceani]|uniref:Peptidase M14 domain-containing protein n=1 Tax=Paenibacillus oceani TaxID=2772510 RepID=A0A927H253_9BACL|nr:M14 family zinc carboxypeptidase [Paenibacillus oceani]MBD2864902.1 hypothetical protein [Paenibacillus oceani]